MTTSTTDAHGGYAGVSETPGAGIAAEALAMNRVRHGFAARHAAGRDVLKVACGPGQGLGALHRVARRVVARDYTAAFVEEAARHYNGRVPVLRLDAHRLRFAATAFDVVVLFEGLYYDRMEEFLAECPPVLRPGGGLLLCTANPQCCGFNPSP